MVGKGVAEGSNGDGEAVGVADGVWGGGEGNAGLGPVGMGLATLVWVTTRVAVCTAGTGGPSTPLHAERQPNRKLTLKTPIIITRNICINTPVISVPKRIKKTLKSVSSCAKVE